MQTTATLPFKFLAHLLIALAAACLLILPDYLYASITGSGPILFRPYTLGVLFTISFLLLALRSRMAVFGLIGFFFLLQLGQLLHVAYFGTSFAPHEIRLLFGELAEVQESLAGVAGLVLPPLLIVAGSYAALALLLRTTRNYRLHVSLAALPLALLLLVLPIRAYTSDESQRFYPNPKTYMLENALQAFSYFMVRDLPSHLAHRQEAHWKPYVVERSRPPAHANIVVVMGESLTPAHMSLFGYGRATTPQLETLRTDKDFIYRQGIAAGVATKVSLPMFFNIAREPDNTAQIFRQSSNLIKLARAQGFLTHYYSTQTANLSTFSGIEYADDTLTAENLGQALDIQHDEALLSRVKRLDLKRPNFIVLHQRNSHSPYDSGYPAEYDFYKSAAGKKTNQYRVDSYDNSVRYTDHLLYSLIQDVKARSPLPVYIVFTSDHGEMLGERGGQFGHAKLTEEVARVPFIFYAHNGDAALTNHARQLENPTHYEMGKLIAELLGYRLDNPNQQAGVYYLNGTDLSGSEGYMLVNKRGPYWKLSEPPAASRQR
jgi:glucan phosphoethanolaminetransferase (alkaline phosphatase superfamily)